MQYNVSFTYVSCKFVSLFRFSSYRSLIAIVQKIKNKTYIGPWLLQSILSVPNEKCWTKNTDVQTENSASRNERIGYR